MVNTISKHRKKNLKKNVKIDQILNKFDPRVDIKLIEKCRRQSFGILVQKLGIVIIGDLYLLVYLLLSVLIWIRAVYGSFPT